MSRMNFKDIETNANSLSIKLLKTIGENTGSVSNKKIITNLKDLSNRIKIANKQHENKHPLKFTTEEWIRTEGVDLNLVRQQARFIKEEQKKMSIPVQEVRGEEINPLDPPLKNIQFLDFSFKIEERLAYRAILQSLSSPSNEDKPPSQIKKLIKSTINRLGDVKKADVKFPKTNFPTQPSSDWEAELIKVYQECLSENSFSEFHLSLYNKFKSETNQKWVSLIFNLVEMAHRVYDPQETQNNFKNYFSAIALDELEKLFKEQCINEDKLLMKYNPQQQPQPYDRWRELYFLLRRGDRELFVSNCKKSHQELAKHYQCIFQSFNQFRKPEIILSGQSSNDAKTIFEKVIKCIGLGHFEKIFQTLNPSSRALEEPWFILMTLGFEEGDSRRKKEFDEAVGAYFKEMRSFILGKEKMNKEVVIDVVIGLLSLGCLKQLLMLFDSLPEKGLYIDFLHLFMVLSANPELIFCLVPKESEALQILRRCLKEIVQYLKYLKYNKWQAFAKYFSFLIYIFSKIQLMKITNFSLQYYAQSLCLDLFTTVEDLTLIDNQVLIAMDNTAPSVKKMFSREFSRSIRPTDQKQYVKLANFFGEIGELRLQQTTLVKMIIFNYYETEREMKESNYFGDPFKSNSSLKQEIKQAEAYLQKTLKKEDAIILEFLTDLKALRGWVMNKRKDILHRNQYNYSRYCQNFQGVFNYLVEIDPNGRGGQCEIFLLYIQLLYHMYRLIYLSSSNLSQFYQERDDLLKDLWIVVRRYPLLEGEVLGRITEKLSQ